MRAIIHSPIIPTNIKQLLSSRNRFHVRCYGTFSENYVVTNRRCKVITLLLIINTQSNEGPIGFIGSVVKNLFIAVRFLLGPFIIMLLIGNFTHIGIRFEVTIQCVSISFKFEVVSGYSCLNCFTSSIPWPLKAKFLCKFMNQKLISTMNITK